MHWEALTLSCVLAAVLPVAGEAAAATEMKEIEEAVLR